MNKDHVTELVHAAATRLVRHFRRADASKGMTPARLSALSHLIQQGPTPLGELAKVEKVKA